MVPPSSGGSGSSVSAAGADEPSARVWSVGIGKLRLGTLPIPSGLQTFDAFQHRSFRILFMAISCAGGAYFLQQVVIGWLIYDITESPFITSIVASLEAVPLLVLSPFGGVLVDSLDRRKLLMGVYLYQGVLALALGVGVLAGYVGSAQIIAFMLMFGFAWTINEPAHASVIANIVPREGLINAFALSNLGRAVSRLGIPALGGLMIDVFGAGPTLLTEFSLFTIGAVIIRGVRIKSTLTERPRVSTALAGMLEGARYVKNNGNVLALLLIQFSAPLFAYPFVSALLPVYAAEVYDVDATGLGILVGTSGIGMVMGTLVLASFGHVRRKGILIIASLAAVILSMIGFSLVQWFPAGLVLHTVFSAAHGVYNTATRGSIQSITPDAMRGRVAGLSMATWGSFPITAVLAGALAENVSVQFATLIGACMMAVYVLVVLRVFRSIWRLE